MTALINELAARPGADEVLLVLDDYHLIGAQPVHESLGFLLEHRPPGLHLVLASRTDPPLALARLRARGQLAELRAAELRFTAGRGGGAAAAGGGRARRAPCPMRPWRRWRRGPRDGRPGCSWPRCRCAGSPMSPGSWRRSPAATATSWTILAEEVLERQSEQVRTFLLETSVLERLSGPLCDAVTGRTGSQALLEQVERAGLFLVPLDEVRGWWRYHHLFADLLRARLQQEQPGRVAQLHRNAAAWYEEHGLADDAIRHAVAAGEMTWAARLIEQHFDTVFYLRGEGATIQRWLSALPADLVRSRPRLLLAQAQLAATSGRLEAVEPLLDAAERASAGAADEPFEPTVGRAGSLLVNVPALIALLRSYLAQLRGDAEGTAAFASRALAESGEGRVDAGLHRSGIPGHSRVAPRPARGGRARFRVQHRRVARGRPAHHRPHGAAISSPRSSAPRAAWTRPSGPAGRPWRSPRRPAGQPCRPQARRYVGLAEVAYQRNELDTALRHVTEGIALCRQFVYTPPLAAGLVTLAWIRQATGDPAGALEAIGEAGQAAPGPAGPAQPGPGAAGAAAAGPGRPAAAARWTTRARSRRRRRAGLPAGAGVPGAGPGAARPGPAGPGARAAGPTARRGGRPGPDRQRHRGPGAAGAGAGGWRRGGRRGGRPGRGAHPGLPAGLCPGLRRRGPADGRAARPADRGPAGRPGRRRGPARLPGPAAASLRRRAPARLRAGTPRPCRASSSR